MATKTQIYKEVLREYDALRTRKAAELRERKESLYVRFPRLAEIEETLSMVGVSTAKLVLLHPEEREKAMTEMKQKQQAPAASVSFPSLLFPVPPDAAAPALP